MPELDITEEQASYLDDLREAIEADIVGPYGTVHRKDALQYLMDSFGAPDTLESEPSTSKTGESGTGDTGKPSGEGPKLDETDADGPDAEAESDDENGDKTEAETETKGKDDDSDADTEGDDMLNEMMSLLDTHDDKWTEADTEETKYVVELPDGDSETVQTKDDVRALLFKHHR